MATMKALYFEEHGLTDQLRLGDRPRPEPGAGEVRVRLRAAALNHLDLFVLGGLPGIPVALPHIGGADGAGEVEALGSGVDGVAVGDEVIFDPGLSCGACESCLKGEQSLCVRYGILGEHADGTFAEAVVVPAVSLAKRPEHLSWEESAALPLTFLTAWRMLINRGALSAGESVLIHGIGGGVSLACLQLAKMAGAHVIVTSRSSDKLARALELGADEAIPAGDEVAREVRKLTGKRGVDVVVDSVGRATWMQSLKSAAKGGRIVTCGATTGPDPAEEVRLIFWNQLSIIGSTMGSREDWRRMVAAVSRDRLRPVVDSVMPLSEGRKGYERMEEARQFGKIVLDCGA
ncbi:MAG: zinc-binding dehydrogenase [Acidobacteria bacterium]|nr:zinc-binding dehydrogenase [Acidobacteriota bacterium]